MSHHLIDISAPSCTITCKHGQLICRPEGGEAQQLPMEDIGAVLVSSFSAHIHNRVLLEASRRGTVFIFCENFRPAAMLLPANRATDTLLARAHHRLPDDTRRLLWEKTVTAKCINQGALARSIAGGKLRVGRLERTARGRRRDKESACARLYWGLLAYHLGVRGFRRKRDGEGLNSLLNYGYAVLLARTLQKMMGVGLDPTFGIGHLVRERATPLAYDLMEPFRIAVDARIAAWLLQARTATPAADAASLVEVSPAYKRWVLGFLEMRVPYEGKQMKVERLIEHVLRTFREALLNNRPEAYKPWTLENTKWDGSLSDLISPS